MEGGRERGWRGEGWRVSAGARETGGLARCRRMAASLPHLSHPQKHRGVDMRVCVAAVCVCGGGWTLPPFQQ